MVSLRDIAASVDVSVSLVSKVLNNRLGTTGASEDVIRAIHEMADRLGYRKNASAVALLAGRHNTIGVFIHRLGMAGSGIIEDILDGISDEANQPDHPHQSLQLSFFGTSEQFLGLCEGAHAGLIDGLIVGGIVHTVSIERLRAIRESGVPVVTLYDEPIHASLPNVGLDQVRVGLVATKHLIARGARRIAHIRNTERRYEGYRQALSGAGLAADAALVFDARTMDFSHVTGEKAVGCFLDRKVAFDGLVAQSDQEAMGCINRLSARGLRVPEDVRVIGIDNAPYCEFARVPMSSVSQNCRLRGQEAVRRILAQVAGRKVRSTTVPPVLVPRESSR